MKKDALTQSKITGREQIFGERLKQALSTSEREAGEVKFCFSGIPGAGKTTVSRLLAGKLGAVYIDEFLETLPKCVLDTRGDSSVDQQISAQRWIISQYMAKADLVRGLPKSAIVVQDRGVIDGLAYSAVYKRGVLDVIRTDCEEFDWPPITNVVLVADEDVVKERMVAREGFSEIFFENSWRVYIRQLRDKYTQVAHELDCILIDTSAMTKLEVVDRILKLL